jgi:hypothetical protein
VRPFPVVPVPSRLLSLSNATRVPSPLKIGLPDAPVPWVVEEPFGRDCSVFVPPERVKTSFWPFVSLATRSFALDKNASTEPVELHAGEVETPFPAPVPALLMLHSAVVVPLRA